MIRGKAGSPDLLRRRGAGSWLRCCRHRWRIHPSRTILAGLWLWLYGRAVGLGEDAVALHFELATKKDMINPHIGLEVGIKTVRGARELEARDILRSGIVRIGEEAALVQELVALAILAGVKIADECYREVAGDLSDLLQNQPRAFYPGEGAAVIEVGSENTQGPASRDFLQLHPGADAWEHGIPPGTETLWSQRQPKSASVQRVELVPPVENTHMLTLLRAVIPTVADEVMLRKQGLQVLHLVGQAFLGAYDIEPMKADHPGDDGCTRGPGVPLFDVSLVVISHIKGAEGDGPGHD